MKCAIRTKLIMCSKCCLLTLYRTEAILHTAIKIKLLKLITNLKNKLFQFKMKGFFYNWLKLLL